MKPFTALTTAAVIAASPHAAKADWVAISQDRTVVAWNEPYVNTDGTRDLLVNITSPYGTGYAIFRYRCDLPHFLITVEREGESVRPLVRGSAAEVGYGMACRS